MTTFLRVISCGLIDLHHQDNNQPENSSTTRHAESALPRISTLSSGSQSNNATAPTSPRKNKRLSGQHIVSRLSRRRNRPKTGQGYDGGEGTDATGGAAGASKNVQGLVGATGEDFRIRDEDIAVSAYQPSYAASIASSMTRPHLSLTNTSSAFHEVPGFVMAPPPMPDLDKAMAAAVAAGSETSLDGKTAARPRSGLVNVENNCNDDLVATTPTILDNSGRVGARASPKSMSMTSNTTAATPLTSPRPSTTIERTTNKPDHIHNHTLVVDTALDRHFGF